MYLIYMIIVLVQILVLCAQPNAYDLIPEPQIFCVEKDCEQILLKFSIKNETFAVNVTRNTNLLGSKYFVKYHENDNDNGLNFDRSHCQYHNYFNQFNWAALSICRGEINGIIIQNGSSYHVYFNEEDETHNVVTGNNEYKCGSHPEEGSIRMKRSIIEGTYLKNNNTRFVELILVNDHSVYKLHKRDKKLLTEKNQQIVNIVNSFFRQLNVIVILVGVIIWSDHDEIKMPSNPNVDQMLDDFLVYADKKITPKYINDNVQLLTGIKFENNVVGKAIKSSICMQKYSGGVNYFQSKVIGQVAATLAHEMGHNFGMDHDKNWCKCPDGPNNCIMADSLANFIPKQWSSCSLEAFQTTMLNGMDNCLKNVPNQSVLSSCGNGLLEKGEECDCGLPEKCKNKCCDASSCKLTKGARCATGSCCDLITCQIIKAEEKILCRNAVNECDIAENCNGQSEFCPTDDFKKNGVECKDGTAYCYNSQCNTHDEQCKSLWGGKAKSAPDKCFDENLNGNQHGNCGKLDGDEFKKCSTSDVKCGVLHCTTSAKSLIYGSGWLSAVLSTTSFWKGSSRIDCKSVILKLGSQTKNPGIVFDGTKCGNDHVCLAQKCVNISSLEAASCPQNCSNHGTCSHKGSCICSDGYAPPTCEEISSGAFSMIALIIILICLIAILFFIATKLKKKNFLEKYRKKPPKIMHSPNRLNIESCTPKMEVKKIKRRAPLSPDDVTIN